MQLTTLLTGSCLAFALAGCTVTTSDPVDNGPILAGDGALVVDWSINGTTDPNQCNQASATTLEITVYPASGRESVFSQDCEAFATSIGLAPGSYSASALLLDGGGNARTTVVDIAPFRILGDDELHTPIDFPASSFF